jgi:hypothetical protein
LISFTKFFFMSKIIKFVNSEITSGITGKKFPTRERLVSDFNCATSIGRVESAPSEIFREQNFCMSGIQRGSKDKRRFGMLQNFSDFFSNLCTK